jgi:hypothetical protein
MQILSRTTAAALVAGTLGLTAFAPVAFAQAQGQGQGQTQAQPPALRDGGSQQNQFDRRGERRQREFHRQRGNRGMGGMMGLLCSERGAERLDRLLGAVSNLAALTDAQKPAFDDLRTTTLAAQTRFADACIAARDAMRADGRPDPVKSLQTRLAIDKARVDAMTEVLPKFEAFYNALTDEQKTALQPSRNGRGFQSRPDGDRRQPGRQPSQMNGESPKG